MPRPERPPADPLAGRTAFISGGSRGIGLAIARVLARARSEPRSAFEMAAGEETRVGGVVEDETTGRLEVYFELDPGNVQRAFNEARGL
jgi:NAD(P)-dependent dehydrogenase (short-subunit alcohol dehydrogenase family)